MQPPSTSYNRDSIFRNFKQFLCPFSKILDLDASITDLNAAAEAGDIKKLYTLIDNDPHVLEKIDKISFVHSPLHTAAYAGQIRFGTEIIRLMPSFAQKLNKQGFSPMHLALQNGHNSMVHCFVSINKDLVRVKGKKGLTPLHFVAKTGETDILAEFFSACPDSIEDLTVEDCSAYFCKEETVCGASSLGWLTMEEFISIARINPKPEQ